MLKNLFKKNNLNDSAKEEYNNPEEMPYLVEYLYCNVPMKGIPINSIYVFTEDAYNLFGAMVTPGIFKVPVIIYKVSETCFNIFNHKLELVGGLVFAKDFRSLQNFGSDLQKKTGFVSYKLMDLAFDYSKTDLLIKQKFENTEMYVPKHQKQS